MKAITWDQLREIWVGERYKVVVSQRHRRLDSERAVIHVKERFAETTLCGGVPKHRWSKHRRKADRHMTQSWDVMRDFEDALNRMDEYGYRYLNESEDAPKVCPRCFGRFKKIMEAEEKAYSDRLDALMENG